jgi:tRNA(fMet)-specific endonuclease VapC
MKYLLDTNICIEIIRRRSVKAIERCEAHARDGICLSAISYSELLFGCEKSAHPAKNRQALEKFLTPIQVLDFPAAAGHDYARLRAVLEKQGQIIGPNDLLIAAHCHYLKSTLVTNNEREFRRVAGLRVINWL